MKTQRFLFVVLLALPGLAAKAQREPQIIYPTTPFDKEDARQMIGVNGTCTLRGQVSKKSNYMVNTVVLFPCTLYFLEWMDLKMKDKKGKKNIFMSEEAFSYRIITKIAKDGSFEFTGLNPGHYFIQTTVTQTKVGSEKVQVGTETITTRNGHGVVIAQGSQPIMERQNFLYRTEENLSSFVEIKTSGQVLTVTL